MRYHEHHDEHGISLILHPENGYDDTLCHHLANRQLSTLLSTLFDNIHARVYRDQEENIHHIPAYQYRIVCYRSTRGRSRSDQHHPDQWRVQIHTRQGLRAEQPFFLVFYRQDGATGLFEPQPDATEFLREIAYVTRDREAEKFLRQPPTDQ